LQRPDLEIQSRRFSDPNLAQSIDQLLFHQEEPFVSSTVHSEWNLYRSSRENTGLKVVLDGQGSDEMLFGYLYLLPLVFQKWAKENSLKI
jgi:asparagine synthase (glutamine-hydrolysing)